MRTIILKNTTQDVKTYYGQTIPAGGSYQLQVGEDTEFAANQQLFTDIGNGVIVVNDGIEDLTDVTYAWSWLIGNQLEAELSQSSDSQGNKVAVHSSAKPMITGKNFYAYWTGSGDGYDSETGTWTGDLGDGEILQFNVTAADTRVTKEIRFNPAHGEVYLYEGFLKWAGAGWNDTLCAAVWAPATPTQQVVSLDLEIGTCEGWNVLRPAAGGPGAGTHGFADPTKIYLFPRPFAKDGWWDFNGGMLTPNVTQTGGFHITAQDTVVHKFVNNFPLFGTDATYVKLGSEESNWLAPGYYVTCSATNNSQTDWTASILLNIYRQRTFFHTGQFSQ